MLQIVEPNAVRRWVLPADQRPNLGTGLCYDGSRNGRDYRRGSRRRSANGRRQNTGRGIVIPSPMRERLARTICQATHGIFKDEFWDAIWRAHLEMEAEFGTAYSAGSSLATDAARQADAILPLITEREKELVAAAREVLPEFPRDPVNGVRAPFSQCERLRKDR